jgi:hypothetical protein
MSGAESWLDRAEDKLSGYINTAEHLALLTGEAGLHAAIQEPIDGITQLANHISKPLTGYELPTLHLIDEPPPAVKGTAEWWAENIGTGLGRAVDYIALGTALSAVGVAGVAGSAVGSMFESEAAATVASAAARAATTGAIYGFGLIPATDDNHFWKQRTIDGLGWALGSGAASLAASGAVAVLDRVGQPLAADGLSNTIAGRTIKAVVGGTTSGLTKNETYMVLGMPDSSPGALGAKLLSSVTKSLTTEAVPAP